MTKRIIIVGATSGIGMAVAQLFIQAGWKVGIAGRREEKLREIVASAPSQVVYRVIDICQEDAGKHLLDLIQQMGGLDYYFHASGIGKQNRSLEIPIEIATTETNVNGFVRMVDTAFNYFKENGGGHIGVISSIAGTKGLGTAPAYSATKRFNNTYIQCLVQLARMQKYPITFTDIKPGFVDTAILNPDRNYPMMMLVPKVAQSIFKALIHRKRKKIIDWRFALLVFFWRCIPDALWERLRISN